MIIKITLALLVAYLLGSIPFAFVITYLKNKTDIRQIGTRNVGTMNVARELGLLPGIAVLALDMAKGCLAIFVAKWLGVSILWVFLTGFAVIVGHSWSPFLKFRGGKGLGPALGVLLALTPLEFVIVFLGILILFRFTRNSGLSAGIGIAVLPLVLWAFGRELELILYPIALGIFTGLRSLLGMNQQVIKDNIKSISKIYPAFWRKKKE
jgi:glycerol-3-phosphate acyltransferase PlsY